MGSGKAAVKKREAAPRFESAVARSRCTGTFKVYWQCMGVTCTWWRPWVVKGGVFIAEIGILGPSTRGSTACTTATPQQKSVGPERQKPRQKPLTLPPCSLQLPPWAALPHPASPRAPASPRQPTAPLPSQPASTEASRLSTWFSTTAGGSLALRCFPRHPQSSQRPGLWQLWLVT